jgi:N-acetyl sugar amidotransferase
MDTTDPEIEFNNNGVCNHCTASEINMQKMWFPNEEGKVKFDKIVNTIKANSRNDEYDCIIGLSGGADSSYLAYILKDQYPDFRILAVHVDGGWNSELAVANIERIVKKLDIDLYTKVVDWKEMKDLQLSYFKSQLANQDVPQDHIFFSTLYSVASQHNIKYFLSGGNLATESILPAAWGHDAMDSRQLMAIQKRFGSLKFKDYKILSFFKGNIFYPYVKRMKIVRPLDFFPYKKKEAIKILEKEIDWVDYGGKHHESKFTRFFQTYWLPKKFGYDKRKAHLSSLIVSKQISRNVALKELKIAHYSEEELIEDKNYIAKKLGISIKDFDVIMSQPNKSYTDYPNSDNMKICLRFLSKLKSFFN